MNKLNRALGSIAAIAMAAAAGEAGATVTIDVTQAGGDVAVAASGSLDLTGATYEFSESYTTGIISGVPNWYVALGATPGNDWYALTGVDLPFGTDPAYYTSALTSGDAFSIWGNNGAQPLVGVSTGYVSGTPISATMTLTGETIAGLGLLPGSYTFAIPSDTIILDIADGGGVPEPATWALMLVGVGSLGVAARTRRHGSVSA